MRWSKAQMRCYDAIRSGAVVHSGEVLRFLTLTSVKDIRKPILTCFRLLVKRISRLCPNDFVKLGLITSQMLGYYFPYRDVGNSLVFEYLFVLTSEGNGVLHVLYYGDFIHEKWLKDNWELISGGRNLFIENVLDSDISLDEVSKYVVNQSKVFNYVSAQSKFIKHGYSRNFVYPYWKVDFYSMRKDYSHSCYEMFGDWNHFDFKVFWSMWSKWLSSGEFNSKSYDIKVLEDFGIK